MDALTLVGKLILDSSSFFNSLSGLVSGSGASTLISKSAAVGNLAANIITKTINAAVSAGRSVIETGMNFDEAMAAVKSVKMMSDSEYKEIREKALELGRTTKFTAEETANAFYYMGQAGWTTQEMLEGIEGVLQLAAASGGDLSRVSDILTDSISNFGLSASETGHYVDVLAAAAANSNTTIEKMGEAFKYLSPVAKTMNYSIEDIGAALGIVANNGIKASQAGTTWRQVLLSLSAPKGDAAEAIKRLGISAWDESGNKAKSFRELMNDMRQAVKDSGYNAAGKYIASMSAKEEEFAASVEEARAAYEAGTMSLEEYDAAIADHDRRMALLSGTNQEFIKDIREIAGLRGISTMLSLMNSSEEDFNNLLEQLDKSAGAAAKMQETRMDNLKGDLQLLGNTLDNLKITLSDTFNEDLRSFIQGLTDNVNRLTDIVKYGFFGDGGIMDLENGLANAEERGEDSIATAEANALKAKSLYEQLSAMSQSLGETGQGLETWQKAAQDLIDLCPSLAKKIDLVNGSFLADKDAIYADIDAMTDRAKAMALQNVLSDKLAALTKAEGEEINRRVEVIRAQAEFDAAMSPALEKVNAMLSQYGVVFDSNGEDKTFASTVDEMQTALRALEQAGQRKGVTNEELNGLYELVNKAQDAEDKLNNATTAQENLSAKLDEAKAEYADYSSAVQGMIDELSGMRDAINDIPDSKNVDITVTYHEAGRQKNISGTGGSIFTTGKADGGPVGKKAIGDLNVPYDNYPALLHRGEIVLNQTRARQYRNNDNSQSAIDTEALTSAIVDAVVKGMANAQFFLDGKALTDMVSRRQGDQLQLRR